MRDLRDFAEGDLLVVGGGGMQGLGIGDRGEGGGKGEGGRGVWVFRGEGVE